MQTQHSFRPRPSSHRAQRSEARLIGCKSRTDEEIAQEMDRFMREVAPAFEGKHKKRTA
jgi:hypothetical protein